MHDVRGGVFFLRFPKVCATMSQTQWAGWQSARLWRRHQWQKARDKQRGTKFGGRTFGDLIEQANETQRFGGYYGGPVSQSMVEFHTGWLNFADPNHPWTIWLFNIKKIITK